MSSFQKPDMADCEMPYFAGEHSLPLQYIERVFDKTTCISQLTKNRAARGADFQAHRNHKSKAFLIAVPVKVLSAFADC